MQVPILKCFHVSVGPGGVSKKVKPMALQPLARWKVPAGYSFTVSSYESFQFFVSTRCA